MNIFSLPELKAQDELLESLFVHSPSVHLHLWTTSPLKPLGQFSSNFSWRLLSMGGGGGGGGWGDWKFVQTVSVCYSRWLPCLYILKILQNNLLQYQESFKAENWYIASGTRSTKFIQMMTLGWHLTFLQQGQICVPMHLYGVNIVNLLKINGWNLQSVRE